MIKKILFTKQGLQDQLDELYRLEKQRKEAVKNLQAAREMGDLSENAAYKVARSRLSSIDNRIRRIKAVTAQAQVVEKKENDLVDIGSYVTVINKGKSQTFQIVGGYESDIYKNKISSFAPIGRALMNHKVNDIIKVRIPIGEVEYQITEIKNQ